MSTSTAFDVGATLTCDLCNHTFSRLEHLQRHRRTHTNERPFSCACGQSFTRRDLLTRHRRIRGNHEYGRNHRSKPPGRHESHVVGTLDEVPPPYAATETCRQEGSVAVSGHDDLFALDPVQDFAAFTRTMGLNADWNMFPTPFDSLDLDGMGMDTGRPAGAIRLPGAPQAPQALLRPNKTMLEANTDSAGECPGKGLDEPDPYANTMATNPAWNVSLHRYEQLQNCIQPFQNMLADFVLPSRHALTRYLSGYFEGYHSHMPFIHKPTFRLESCAPELVLAMAAIGAQYRFESHFGLYLFDASKAISREQATRRAWKYRPPGSQSSPSPQDILIRRACMQTVSALLLLIAFATWEDDPMMLQEAIGFQSVVANCLRLQGFTENLDGVTDAVCPTWHEWCLVESDRRVKWLVFCYLTLHSVTYNIPPVLGNHEMRLRLPCSSAKWNAETELEWRRAGGANGEESWFQDILEALIKTPGPETSASGMRTFSLGNMITIHALLQRIYLTRQFSSSPDSYTADLRAQLERALHRWKIGWQQAPESSLDPLNPNGPIPFASSAFLALAHVRLAADLGPHMALMTRDPASIADALQGLPPIPDSSSFDAALLHSAHMLSVPIKLGVDFVAKSQHFFWSVQHCVCSLECAVFLARWLCQNGSQADALEGTKKRTLLWLASMVAEASSEPGRPSVSEDTRILSPRSIALEAVRIWAVIFKGHTSWSIVNMLGQSLDIVADMIARNTIWKE